MSARRLFAALLGAGLLLALRAAPARAVTDSILVRVGGDLAARATQYLDVPITVDLSGAPGRALGSYTATLQFDSTVFYFEGVTNGNFAQPQVNSSQAADSGKVVVTAIQPPGATGAVQIFIARFYVRVDANPSVISVSFSEMSATATSVNPFESLLPLLKIVNGTFCRSLGRWGDVNGDGVANSLDALMVLSYVVGDSLPPSVNIALGDVDGDGNVNSRDALIILSYAVGLPVPGTRVLLVAAGACGTGVAANLTITPDSLELQVGQEVPVAVAAVDSTGRAVPVDSVSWSSSNPGVAAFDVNNGAVQARGPGLATLTVQLGPSIWGTLKVNVLARRTTWYVDVERARFAPTQVGSQNLPLEFIGDAVSLAHNGDTVRIAGGTYEEMISFYDSPGQGAVALIGDSLNRPVIDPRGYGSSWYEYDDALDLEPYEGRIELANLDIRAGRTYLDAHDFFIHNVLIEGLNTQGTGLDVYSENLTPSGAPRTGGPMRSSVPEAVGNVLIDGITVTGDSLETGIEVDQADSVVIRNSSIRRSQQGTSPSCGAGPYTNAGIQVQQASVSLAQSDTVVNPQCQGIALFDDNNSTLLSDVSRATATHNVVTGAPGTGIALGARLVSSDHNVVSNTGRVPGQSSYGSAVGIVASWYDIPPDTVWSLGDVIVGSGGRGFAVDTAAKAVIDSLVVAGAGLDSSDYGVGVTLGPGGTYWLSHSQISNVVYAEGVLFTGDHAVLHSHGNHIADVWGDGLTTYQGCEECSPPARPSGAPAGASLPQRAGPYTGGPDTLTSVADTVLNAAGNGIYQEYGVSALVDSFVVDTAGNEGVSLWKVSRVTISRSKVSGAYDGIEAYYVDTLSLVGDRVAGSSGDGLYVYNYLAPDSTRVIGSTFASNGGYGIDLDYANARVDSSAFVYNHGGMYLDYGGGALVRWSRFQWNGIGLWMSGSVGSPSTVIHSNFLSDTTAGVENDATSYMLTADTNYWGDRNGPRCTGGAVGCNETSVAGDYVSGYGLLSFLGYLADTAPTLSPPLRVAAVALRTPARAASSRPANAHGAAARVTSARPPVADRAARVAADAAALSQRPQRQRPAAWHAPSKAKTHAVQITVKKRT